MLMVSKTKHTYDHRVLSPGETFEADDKLVPLLVALGRAEKAPEQQYRTREMKAKRK